MKYPYFRGLEADRYSFYRVPKALIKVDLFEKMSGDAKLLYAVLLDRMNLSLKNGWQDENGNAYIICTIDEIMDSIRCARQKAVKLLDELEHEYQLIERRRQGLGKPNLLYVKDLYAGLSQSNYWKYENQTSGGLKSELPGVWKSNVWNKKGGQRWEIDPEAAPCVKKVFELALSGRNTTQIAYGMNELNLPTPGLYAKRKNLLMGSNPIIAPDSEMLWNAAIVWRILRRYEYTGALVMGRRKKIDVNTTSVRTLPEDKWIIAENAHEAIVTKDEYYQAQKAIRNVTPIQYKVGDDFALKGKICCGNCNRQLRHERQYGEMVFYCGYKRSAGKFSKCYGGYYREYSVNAKVARAIKTVFYALDVVNQGMQEKQSITVRCVDIEDLEKQAEAIRVEQIKLYESYADGVLRRDVYIEKKKTLSEKLAALQDSIRTEKEEQECADELDEEIRNLTKQASQKTYIGGLTKECVDAFVSMVYLYDDQTMKVEFNCEDVIRRALEKYGA